MNVSRVITTHVPVKIAQKVLKMASVLVEFGVNEYDLFVVL